MTHRRLAWPVGSRDLVTSRHVLPVWTTLETGQFDADTPVQRGRMVSSSTELPLGDGPSQRDLSRVERGHERGLAITSRAGTVCSWRTETPAAQPSSPRSATPSAASQRTPPNGHPWLRSSSSRGSAGSPDARDCSAGWAFSASSPWVSASYTCCSPWCSRSPTALQAANVLTSQVREDVRLHTPAVRGDGLAEVGPARLVLAVPRP